MKDRSRDTRPIAVLGLGRFGERLAKNLARGGVDVIACDRSRPLVEQIADDVAQAVALDVTDEQALRARGVHTVRAAVVAIGEHFETAVMATAILRQMEVPRIIARARSRTMAEVLERVGAHEVVLAEDEAADRWANRLLGPRVLNQIEFHEGYSIVEIAAPARWVGRSMIELDVRKRFGVHVVAVRRQREGGPARIVVPGPGEPLAEHDVLIIMGRDEDIATLED